MTLSIQRLALVGVGLIGGALARSLRAAGACAHVAGCDADAGAVRTALELGVIDSGAADLATVVDGAELVVLAVPLGEYPSLFARLAPLLGTGTVVTDVGSSKQCVMEAARSRLGQHYPRFVPGHPVAGTEKSGVANAPADLFRQRLVILTPDPVTEPAAVERVSGMWRATGAEVVSMDAAHHDRVLAATSHLPHMLAYALVDCLARMDEREEIFRFAAGGFADFTRIAASSPRMWRDVCLGNRDNMLGMIDEFSGTLGAIREAIAAGDGDALTEVFERARRAREGFATARGPRSAPG